MSTRGLDSNGYLVVVVGVDFSDSTDQVVATTSRLLRLGGGHVYLIHVAEPEPEFVGLDVGPRRTREDWAARFREEHRRIQALKNRKWPERVQVTPLLVQGPVAETLLEESVRLGAQAIVLGSFGHGTIRDALLGSIATTVLRSAPCPVVVVPSPPASDN